MSLSHRVPLLLRRARALLGLGPGPDDRLARAELRRCARAVEELHEGLVGRRELARASTYGQPAHLAAYLLWWWPQTYAKVRAALALARSAGALQGLPGQPRILDVAAGPGAAGLALLDALGGTALALDQSAAALSEGRALSGGALRTQEADLRRGLPALESDFDLAVVANALSELPAPVRVPLIGALPVADGAWKAAAPCLTQRPCPALQHPRDWCTAQHAWDPPPHVGQLAAELGLRADQELAYAPLVLTRRVAQPPPDVWRVVGVPQPEKGKKRLFVCSDQGRMPVARLSRDATAQNADFDRLGRGDLALLRGAAPKGDGLRIGPAGEVRRIDRLDAETPAASGVSEPG